MLRSSSSLSRGFASPQEVHTGALRHGLRRYRTGPDHTGFSRLHRFLRDHGLGVALAEDRQLWEQSRDMWVSAFPVRHQTIGQNIYSVDESHMAWHVRCWQGVCFGSQTIFARLGASATLGQYLQVCHLDCDDGWQGMHVQCAESCTFDDVVAFFLGPFLASSTVHIRLFLYIGSTLEQLSIPTSCRLLWHRRIICEVSVLEWDHDVCSTFSDGVGWPSFPSSPELGRSSACEAGSNIG